MLNPYHDHNASLKYHHDHISHYHNVSLKYDNQRWSWTLPLCLLLCNIHQDKQNIEVWKCFNIFIFLIVQYLYIFFNISIFSIFTKTIADSMWWMNRFISDRIFSGASKGQKNTQWISPRSQLAICSGFSISISAQMNKKYKFLEDRLGGNFSLYIIGKIQKKI